VYGDLLLSHRSHFAVAEPSSVPSRAARCWAFNFRGTLLHLRLSRATQSWAKSVGQCISASCYESCWVNISFLSNSDISGTLPIPVPSWYDGFILMLSPPPYILLSSKKRARGWFVVRMKRRCADHKFSLYLPLHFPVLHTIRFRGFSTQAIAASKILDQDNTLDFDVESQRRFLSRLAKDLGIYEVCFLHFFFFLCRFSS